MCFQTKPQGQATQEVVKREAESKLAAVPFPMDYCSLPVLGQLGADGPVSRHALWTPPLLESLASIPLDGPNPVRAIPPNWTSPLSVH